MEIERPIEAGNAPDPPMESRDLRVVLEIERGGPCVMDDFAGDIVDVDVRIEDGSCNVDVTFRDPDSDGEQARTKYFSNCLCEHCPGKVFSTYDCLPRYLEVGDGEFVMETYISDTETVAGLVSDIRDICKRVSVRSIVSTDRSEFEELCTVDITELTMKQREAVHRAQEVGYFDPDSSVSLSDLAEMMDVSPSALSQRLQRAEANVMRQLSCECTCWQNVD